MDDIHYYKNRGTVGEPSLNAEASSENNTEQQMDTEREKHSIRAYSCDNYLLKKNPAAESRIKPETSSSLDNNLCIEPSKRIRLIKIYYITKFNVSSSKKY